MKKKKKKRINQHTHPTEDREKNERNKSTPEPKAHRLSVNVSQLPGHWWQSECKGSEWLCSTSLAWRVERAGDERSRLQLWVFRFIYRTMWNVLISIGDGAGKDVRTWIRPRQSCCVPLCMCSFTCHFSISFPSFSAITLFLAVFFFFLLLNGGAGNSVNPSGSRKVSRNTYPAFSKVLWVVSSRKDQSKQW